MSVFLIVNWPMWMIGNKNRTAQPERNNIHERGKKKQVD